MVDFDIHRAGSIAEQVAVVRQALGDVPAQFDPAVVLLIFHFCRRGEVGVIIHKTALLRLGLRRGGGRTAESPLCCKYRGCGHHHDCRNGCEFFHRFLSL
ncbi:hypothetical protein D3C87_1794870 [compost metagenome]